jgi:acyl carrier protein
VEDQMLRVWQGVFGRPVSAGEDFFLDLGGDSLQAVELVDAVVEAFGVPVSIADLFDRPTPGELVSVVEGLLLDVNDADRGQRSSEPMR